MRPILFLSGDRLLLTGAVTLGDGQLFVAPGFRRVVHGLATTSDRQRFLLLGTNRKGRDRQRRPDEGQEHRSCSSRGDPVSTGQSGNGVDEAHRSSGDGIANEISAQVGRKLGGTGVTALPILLQALVHDRREIAAERLVDG